MKESRLEFAQEWHERGSQSLNQNKPFESFIYNWLALTISAKTYIYSTLGRLKTERTPTKKT